MNDIIKNCPVRTTVSTGSGAEISAHCPMGFECTADTNPSGCPFIYWQLSGRLCGLANGEIFPMAIHIDDLHWRDENNLKP